MFIHHAFTTGYAGAAGFGGRGFSFVAGRDAASSAAERRGDAARGVPPPRRLGVDPR